MYSCLSTEVDKRNLTFHNILIPLATFVCITLMCVFQLNSRCIDIYPKQLCGTDSFDIYSRYCDTSSCVSNLFARFKDNLFTMNHSLNLFISVSIISINSLTSDPEQTYLCHPQMPFHNVRNPQNIIYVQKKKGWSKNRTLQSTTFTMLHL